MEFFGKTRKVGGSVVVTVPKSVNIREEKNVHVSIKEVSSFKDELFRQVESLDSIYGIPIVKVPTEPDKVPVKMKVEE